MRDEFMGIVSHDLLNLLNAMVGVSSLIEMEVAEENHVERVVTHARRVQRSGARMRRLVGDLFDVASIEPGMAVTRAVADPSEVVMMPVPHPEVNREVDARCAESGLQPIDLPARDRGQWGHAAEELVVPGDGLQPLRRDAAAAEHAGQKRLDVGRPFGYAKGDHEDGIERPTCHATTPNRRRITSPRY